LTEHSTEPILNAHILPRIAMLINTYLEHLVGRGSELNVENKQEYHFDPKLLLTTIIKIFLSLCGQQIFLEGIVNRDAHFNMDNFSKAAKFLRKHQLMQAAQIDEFEVKINTLNSQPMENQDIESMLGDIPEEYLDPIMQTLMRDPVIFTSKNTKQNFICDRKVIERHILNDPTNPFNREPLTMEELRPHHSLKKKIDEWIKFTLEKRGHSQQKK